MALALKPKCEEFYPRRFSLIEMRGGGDWLAAIGQELGDVDINFERSRETYRPLSLD